MTDSPHHQSVPRTLAATQAGSRSTLGTHLRAAVLGGLVGGTLVGIIEGALCIIDNGDVEVARYATFYFFALVLGWTVLALLVLVPISFVVGGVRSVVDRRPAGRVQSIGILYAAPLVGAAVGQLIISWLATEVGRAQLAGGQEDASAIRAAGAIIVVVAAFALLAALTNIRRRSKNWPAHRHLLVALVVVSLAINGLAFANLLSRANTEGRGLPFGIAAGDSLGPGELAVVLISLDTVRADRLGAYGSSELTPNLDRLAREGAVFEAAISPAPWTLPALASLMTGMLPHEHGGGWPTTETGGPLQRTPVSAVPTLAEALRRGGYVTQAIVTNPYCSLYFGLGAGFTGFLNVTVEAEALRALSRRALYQILDRLFGIGRFNDRAESVTSRAIRWLRTHRGERAFLWLHYIDAHAPYGDPKENASKSFRGDMQRQSASDTSDALGSLDIARLRSGEITLSDNDKQRFAEKYDREISYLDSEVGRVFAAIDTLGLAGQTLIVVVGDHGEEFWDHGRVEHGHSLYDELLRVPLILKGPGVPPGLRIRGTVSTVDLAPTILDLLGRPPLAPDKAKSLRGRFLTDPPIDSYAAVAENLLFAEQGRAIRTDSYKYVHWNDGREELYDIVADPGERKNRAGCTGAADHARAELAMRFAATPHEDRGTSPPAVDPRVRSGIRALGYAE